MIPVIEDNIPLAFCDSRSVTPSDLVHADRSGLHIRFFVATVKLFSHILSFETAKAANMALEHNLDLLTGTAGDVRRLLESGDISSVELVKLYLKQITTHNHEGMKLNAMISVAPEDLLLLEAKELDEERASTGPRSRMHGIPIILKV